MSDEPEEPPELVVPFRVGSVMSGECSVCPEVMLVRGTGIETPEELVYMLKHAFLGHVRNTLSPES
jgi:hypothetical protein